MASPNPPELRAPLELTPDEKAELDRRWAETIAEPDPAVSLSDVIGRLGDPDSL
jgi:hypothetical protein